MKYLLAIIFCVFIFFNFTKTVSAEVNAYKISNFSSNITINQDNSISVTEKIKVNFNQIHFGDLKHGIFRYIPSIYRTKDKFINSRLTILSVKDENDKNYQYKTFREGDNLVIKIGDPDVLIQSDKTYIISYKAHSIVQRFEDHDEFYWNITGSDWDMDILNAEVFVQSYSANIISYKCFSCDFNLTEKNKIIAQSNSDFENGKNDITIVVGFDKNNSINFKKNLDDYIFEYWGYPVSIFPFLVMFIAWFKKGRDIKNVGDNIYFQEKNTKTENAPLFGHREFLPFVYSPIDGLTPSEVGAILDEKIDIQDIVAEITELGRLGFLEISKIDKKWAIDDYEIKKTGNKNIEKLRDYQKYLYESLFERSGDNNKVLLSELKPKFYTKLEKFKDLLYSSLKDKKYFENRPDNTKIKWFAVCFVIVLVSGVALSFYEGSMYASLLKIIHVFSSCLGFIFANKMSRRAPLGYSMYRQIVGLKHYINVGKWRQEFAEKQLFLKDILPLAISLGVVTKLARDMESLGVKPPSYFHTNSVAWAGSFNSFTTSTASSMIGSSKSSSFSGGSGFSGGGGGGFGGGGGGSW